MAATTASPASPAAFPGTASRQFSMSFPTYVALVDLPAQVDAPVAFGELDNLDIIRQTVLLVTHLATSSHSSLIIPAKSGAITPTGPSSERIIRS